MGSRSWVFNPNRGHSSISFPKMFFKNMSAPLVLFLGSDSWWFRVRISSNISASLNSCGGRLRRRRGRRVFVVFCLIYSRPMTMIPHICDPLQHNTYKHTVVFAAGKINTALFDSSVPTECYFTPKMKVLSSFTQRLVSKYMICLQYSKSSQVIWCLFVKNKPKFKFFFCWKVSCSS